MDFNVFVTGSPRRVAAAAAAQAAQCAAVQLPQSPQLTRVAAAEATTELRAAKEAELRGLRAACEAWQSVHSEQAGLRAYTETYVALGGPAAVPAGLRGLLESRQQKAGCSNPEEFAMSKPGQLSVLLAACSDATTGGVTSGAREPDAKRARPSGPSDESSGTALRRVINAISSPCTPRAPSVGAAVESDSAQSPLAPPFRSRTARAVRWCDGGA